MIFVQIHEIASGQKTQTRRVKKTSETASFPLRRVYSWDRVKWEVGRTYAVQPKRAAKTHIHNGSPLRIRITGLRLARLQDITEEDAQAEGVPSVEEYRRLWKNINKARGTRWEDNPFVWVIKFEVA